MWFFFLCDSLNSTDSQVFFKNRPGEEYGLGSECLLPNGVVAQAIRPVLVPKSHKKWKDFTSGRKSRSYKRKYWQWFENKLLILLMSFFFKLSVLLSFKSHPPHPVSQEVCFWFLLSPHYQVFHSLRSVSLPSPHCSTLSREVWLCHLTLHPTFMTLPARILCWASYTAFQW